jgi:hypothetical protein
MDDLTENAVFRSLNLMILLAYPGFRAKNPNRPQWSNLIRPAAWEHAAYPENLTANGAVEKRITADIHLY